MSGLTCSCDGDFEWFYSPQEDFSRTPLDSRRQCQGCFKPVGIAAVCLRIDCFSYDDDGEEAPLSDGFLCESCGEIMLNLTDAGYCITLGDDLLPNLMRDYREVANRC